MNYVVAFIRKNSDSDYWLKHGEMSSESLSYYGEVEKVKESLIEKGFQVAESGVPYEGQILVVEPDKNRLLRSVHGVKPRYSDIRVFESKSSFDLGKSIRDVPGLAEGAPLDKWSLPLVGEEVSSSKKELPPDPWVDKWEKRLLDEGK